MVGVVVIGSGSQLNGDFAVGVGDGAVQRGERVDVAGGVEVDAGAGGAGDGVTGLAIVGGSGAGSKEPEAVEQPGREAGELEFGVDVGQRVEGLGVAEERVARGAGGEVGGGGGAGLSAPVPPGRRQAGPGHGLALRRRS